MSTDLTSVAVWLADFDGGHMDGGWWVVMVLFWGLLIVGGTWLVRELAGRRRREPDALELLDRRLAEGTISPEDYRERRAILTGPSPRGE